MAKTSKMEENRLQKNRLPAYLEVSFAFAPHYKNEKAVFVPFVAVGLFSTTPRGYEFSYRFW